VPFGLDPWVGSRPLRQNTLIHLSKIAWTSSPHRALVLPAVAGEGVRVTQATSLSAGSGILSARFFLSTPFGLTQKKFLTVYQPDADDRGEEKGRGHDPATLKGLTVVLPIYLLSSRFLWCISSPWFNERGVIVEPLTRLSSRPPGTLANPLSGPSCRILLRAPHAHPSCAARPESRLRPPAMPKTDEEMLVPDPSVRLLSVHRSASPTRRK
jgi:hypothetical protein